MTNNPLESLSPKNFKLFLFTVAGIYFIIELLQSGKDFSRPAYISALSILTLHLIKSLIKGEISKETIIVAPGYFGILYFAYTIILEMGLFIYHSSSSILSNPAKDPLGTISPLLLGFTEYPDTVSVIYVVFMDTVGRGVYKHFVKNGSVKDSSNDFVTEASIVLLIQALLAFFFAIVITTSSSVIWKFFLEQK